MPLLLLLTRSVAAATSWASHRVTLGVLALAGALDKGAPLDPAAAQVRGRRAASEGFDCIDLCELCSFMPSGVPVVYGCTRQSC
jgi:hypothetical protein